MNVDSSQEKKGLQVAGGVIWSVWGSSGAQAQVQCTWKFDALTNSRWWRIFAKVKFVSVVSNIIVQGRLQLDLVWSVCRQGKSCVLIGHLYPRPLIYSGARHTM